AATGGTAVDDSGVGTIGPFIVANAKLVPYTADLAISAGCPIGFSFNPSFPTGPMTGTASIPFVETITAPTIVGSYSCAITATTDWGLPGSGAGCKVTGGGRITTADGDKATFGGNAKGAGPSGQEEYQDHGPAAAMNLHSIDVLAVVCSADGLSASIFGTATI